MNDAQSQALLEQLRGIQAPDLSAWPAPGWWFLALLLVILIFTLRHVYRRYLARRWQRQARTELQQIRRQSSDQPVNQTLAACSRLTRRVLMKVLGREQVAGLHGQAWLDALDDVAQRPLFASGFGKLLEAGPYQRAPEVAEHDLHSLCDAIEELIRAAGRQRAPAKSGQ